MRLAPVAEPPTWSRTSDDTKLYRGHFQALSKEMTPGQWYAVEDVELDTLRVEALLKRAAKTAGLEVKRRTTGGKRIMYVRRPV